MSDKDFKVKNKLVVNGLTGGAGPLIANSNKEIDSVAFLTTLQGGTGTTTSPSAGQVLYSAGGTSYNPTAINTLDVKGSSYSADAPSSPVIGQIWVESDTTSDSFDPNIIRRKSFTATAGQTTFTTDVEFIQGYEQVFFNGMLLVRNNDYTTTNNTTVVLTTAAAVNDVVEVVTITNLNSINAATTTANTFTGNQVINNTSGTLLSIIADNGIASEPFNIFRSNEAAGIVVKRNNGSYLNPTAILAGERTAFYIGASTDGTSYANHAAINMWAAENQTSTARGSFITFDTTNLLSAGRSEKMRIMPNGKVTIGTSSIYTTTTPTTAKLTVISDSNLNDTDTNSFISLRNKNNTNATTVVGGILSDTYRDIADPHYSAGMWFNREPYSSNASSGGTIVFGTGSNVLSGALPTERMRINTNGNVGVGWSPDNNWRLSVNESGGTGAGAFLSTTNSTSIFAGLFEAANASYVGVIQRLQTYRSNTSAFRFFDAFSSSTSSADLEFNLRGDGQAYADGSWNAGGADYAEYFEWVDGNPDNEDRRGYSVSLVGKKIKIVEEGESPIGVISGNPSIIGDAGWNSWNRKYLVDDFGSYIRDDNGERILNPDFDPDQEYVSREDRPEWAIVGLMGKLRLRKGQVTGAAWIKMDDISEQVEEWLVK